jgi:hypothetical protein
MIPTPFQSRLAILVNAIVLAMLSGCGGGEPVPVVPTNEASSRSANSFAQTLERSPTAAGTVTALAAPRGAGLTASGAASASTPAAAATAGVLLDGTAGMNAIAALRDYTAPASSESTGLAKPRVEAILSPNALVGQVNSALTLVGARIVGMQSGNSRLMLELDSAGASTTAEALSQRLAYSRAFEPYQPAPPEVEDHQSPTAPIDTQPAP